MNKKGFTLMEILGSIIIISIIGVLAVVTFTNNMKGFREDYYIETVRTLTESGKEFFNDNKKYRPSDVLTSQIVPVNTLVTQKYLDDVTDYKGNSCSASSYVIVIKNGKDDYTYHTCLVCPEDDYSNMTDKYCDEAWRTSTSIEYTIATPPELYIYLGTPRSSLRDLLAIKASYVKKNSKGEVIGVVDGTGFDETPTIYPENFDTVDTNRIGVYPINYEYQGKTTTGHVTVYKFEEPIFTIKKQETYATDLHGHTTTSLKELYVSGTWTQKIFITLSAGASTAEAMPNTVNRYQWNKDGVWQDLCLGTSCTEKEITLEMNENIKFRSISVDNKISDESAVTNIKIDNTKPACTLNKTGQQKTSDWYTSDVTVTFNRKEDLVRTGVEDVSGVKYHNITISTGAFSHTNNTQAIHNYDTKGVKYIGYVEDQARNFITCSIEFRRDATDPTCSLKTIGTRENDSNEWYNSSSVGITFKAKADLDDKGTTTNSSGIKITKITGNGNEHATLVTDPADTDWVTYTGYVEDNAGNNVTCTTRYKKDSTQPECSMDTSGTMGNDDWYVSDVSIFFTSHTDNLSGVRNYGIGSTTSDRTATHTSDTAGTTYTGHIIDEAGNSNTCTTTFKRDVTPPNCTLKTTGSRENASNTWYNSSSVAISFNVKNDLDDQGGTTNRSGIRTTKITGNGNEHATLVNDSADTGGVTYDGYIEDIAGNSNTCSVWYKKDSTKPQCALTTSGTHATGNSWYQGTVTISFVAASTSDNLSGIRSNRIGTSTTDGGSVTHSTDTTGITYTATIVDNAGNSDTCSTTFKKDGTAPVCTISGHASVYCRDDTSKLVYVKYASHGGHGVGLTFMTVRPQSEYSGTASTIQYNGTWTVEAKDEADNSYETSTTYCLITYSANGGDSGPTKSSEILRETESADLSPTARKGGYRMIGWNTDSGASSGLSSYTVPSQDTVTLYAIYEQCPNAYYTNGNGTSCLQCPEGYRAGGPAADITGCRKDVEAGYHVASANAQETECGTGYYKEAHSVYYGSTSSCNLCPTYYQNGTALANKTSQSVCLQSVACGKRVASAGAQASNCAAGTYNTAHSVTYGNTSSCTNCEAGSYAPNAGACSCSDCPAGTYNTTAGSSTCKACDSGYYKTNSSKAGCSPCPAGSWCTKTKKTPCDAGKSSSPYSDSNSDCYNCTAGTYNGTAGGICTACEAGTYSSNGSTSCSTCSAGTYSSAGASSCTNCAAGTYSSAGASSCTNCAAGTYSSAGASSCTNCAAGKYSSAGASSCTNCAAGKYSSAGASSCSTCSAGTYSSAGSSSCTACTGNTYSGAGASSCSGCGTGKTANSTHTGCNTTTTSSSSGSGGGGGGCFLKGTPVATKDGFKNIETLTDKDYVLSYNEETGETEYKRVEQLLIHEDNTEDLYTLTIDDFKLKVTEKHRFYILRISYFGNKEVKDYIAAKNLRIGDKVMYSDGSYHKITNISYIEKTDTVYNIQVEDNHNYFVSEKQILVHNAKAKD